MKGMSMQPIRLWIVCLLSLIFANSLLGEETPKKLSPEEAKKAFLKLLDRPKVPADIQTISEPKEEGEFITEHFSFASEKKADGKIERVPVLLIRPKKEGPLPAVIVLHGTGGTKESQRSWLMDLAKRDMIGVAIDARYHGERSGGVKGSAAYVAAITKAWRATENQEHPFYYDTCWDLWRLLDVLESRKEIDSKRIGMIGISMGGIQTWLSAAIDDRVQVAAPLIAVQSFRWSLDNNQWQGRAKTIQATHDAAAKDLNESMVNAKVCRVLWNKVIPGILTDFDCPNLLPLFANRSLFIANGAKDPNCPFEGTKIAIQEAEKAFGSKNRKEHLKVMIQDVAHTVTPEARKETLEFVQKWLKP
jgi:dienelactone hydrolase